MKIFGTLGMLALTTAISAVASGNPSVSPGPAAARSFESRVPDTAKWRAAVALTPEMRRPEKISGRLPDLQKATRGKRYFLGTCVLAAVISKQGTVDEVHVLTPAEEAPEVRRTLAAALSTWKFRPCVRNGQPVAVRYFLTVSDCPYRLARP
jgi:hypothetical protein